MHNNYTLRVSRTFILISLLQTALHSLLQTPKHIKLAADRTLFNRTPTRLWAQNSQNIFDILFNRSRGINKDIYYDDEYRPKFSDGLSSSETVDQDSVDEVLVVGATGQLGRVIVRKLLLEGYRVRVLVRNLYSKTLNLLGPSVTYCVGDLFDMASLELAVTDVDRIIFAAGDPSDKIDESAEINDDRKRRIDREGLANLILAFANVRVVDFGEEQSLKRLIFKFPRDFDCFGIDESYGQEGMWRVNDKGHSEFLGRIQDPRKLDFQKTLISNKLTRSETDGIDFAKLDFAGLVLRVCADGKNYECFFRTTENDEYRCTFQTAKHSLRERNHGKFLTVRLPFSGFVNDMGDTFDGNNVQYIGFRYSTLNNPTYDRSTNYGRRFFLGLSYIKVYRALPEPEFVFVSDGALPMKVSPDMVLHQAKQIIESDKSTGRNSNESTTFELFDEERERLRQIRNIEKGRSLGTSETYYKYVGEELLKNSGLNYCIIRVGGYNNAPGTDEASGVVLTQTPHSDSKRRSKDRVSRADMAAVVVLSLNESNACNSMFYVQSRRRQPDINEGDLKTKFAIIKNE